MRFHRTRFWKYLALLGVLSLSGCAVYHPVALPSTPDLTKTPSVTVPASEFWLPGLKPHSFPTTGLDETAVVTLAVFDNPGLKATRLQAGVASAQLVQAGLLPDPHVSADLARSALNYGGDIGLSQDIQALVTRGAAKAAARSHQKQIHLDILWQEWQVAEKASELFIQARADARLRRVLSTTRALLANRYRKDERALQKGNLTLSTVAADLTLLNTADSNLRKLQLNASQTREQLNRLLGLQPDVRLRLIGPGIGPSLSPVQFHAALAALPHRRADLLALQAGYQAQEENVRRAILAQFPSLSAGVVFSRDPIEGANDFGPSVSLSLPLFNRNRGHIAIERATRAVLRQTYQARLDQAVGNADQVWKATTILRAQIRDLDARLAILRKTASAAAQSYRQGNLSAGVYVNIESSFLARQAEAIRLRASFANAQSVLRSLLGMPFRAP